MSETHYIYIYPTAQDLAKGFSNCVPSNEQVIVTGWSFASINST